MVQTKQVPDLVRQDALNVELPGFAAGRVLKRLAEDNVGFVRKDFRSLNSIVRERRRNRGRTERRRIVGERHDVHAVAADRCGRRGSTIVETNAGAWNVFPGSKRREDCLEIAAVQNLR